MCCRDEPLEEIEHNGCTIRLYDDCDPTDPRENDNLGEMICWHRRYELGDKHSYRQPKDFEETVAPNDLVLPLWLYDHSGITMSCGVRVYPFTDHWDSGQVGYIVCRADKMRQEYSVKRISKEVRARALAVLQTEVEEYDQYLTGQVYGVVVTGPDGAEIDNCWGFFGRDYAIAEAKAACPDAAA